MAFLYLALKSLQLHWWPRVLKGITTFFFQSFASLAALCSQRHLCKKHVKLRLDLVAFNSGFCCCGCAFFHISFFIFIFYFFLLVKPLKD